jgi:hypothetical protein
MQLKEALEGSRLRWEASDDEIKRRDPYGYPNFTHALSRVNRYMDCIRNCGSRWLGLRYKFPLIWLPIRKYQHLYQLRKMRIGG